MEPELSRHLMPSALACGRAVCWRPITLGIYGYYEKAHRPSTPTSPTSISVFSTKVISCSPREALYVLDGLLDNKHDSENSGAYERTPSASPRISLPCVTWLGFYFYCRVSGISRISSCIGLIGFVDYGVFTPLLTKTADLNIVEEQWEEMIRVALSLKQRTAPAHVIVQRLTNSFPSDRLSKAFTKPWGASSKTQYILRYLNRSRTPTEPCSSNSTRANIGI